MLPMVGQVAQPAPGPVAASSSGQRGAGAADGLGPPGGEGNDGEALRATLKTPREELEALALGHGRGTRDRSRRGRGGGEGCRKVGRRSDDRASESSNNWSSRSRSSGSSGSRGHRRRSRKVACWAPRGARAHRLTPEILRNMQTLKFKTRAALLRRSSEKPGALAAQFALATRAALNCEPATPTKHLRKVDMVRWSRDATLLGSDEIAGAADVNTHGVEASTPPRG